MIGIEELQNTTMPQQAPQGMNWAGKLKNLFANPMFQDTMMNFGNAMADDTRYVNYNGIQIPVKKSFGERFKGFSTANNQTMQGYRDADRTAGLYKSLGIDIPIKGFRSADEVANYGKLAVDVRKNEADLENAKFLNNLRLKQAEALGGTFGGSKDPYLTSIDYLLQQGTITQEEANQRIKGWQLNRANNPDYKGNIKYSEKSGTNLADIATGGQAEYTKQTGKNQSDLEYARDTKFQEFLGSKGYQFTPDGQITPIKGTPEYIERTGNLSSSEETSATMLKAIDDVLNDQKGLSSSVGGVAGILGKQSQAMPITEAQRNFQPKIDQLKGKVFMEAYKTLKGGGQITEIEGKKAEQALAKLNQSQSKEAFEQALKDLREVVVTVRDRQRNVYGNTPSVNQVKPSKKQMSADELWDSL